MPDSKHSTVPPSRTTSFKPPYYVADCPPGIRFFFDARQINKRISQGSQDLTWNWLISRLLYNSAPNISLLYCLPVSFSEARILKPQYTSKVRHSWQLFSISFYQPFPYPDEAYTRWRAVIGRENQKSDYLFPNLIMERESRNEKDNQWNMEIKYRATL